MHVCLSALLLRVKLIEIFSGYIVTPWSSPSRTLCCSESGTPYLYQYFWKLITNKVLCCWRSWWLLACSLSHKARRVKLWYCSRFTAFFFEEIWAWASAVSCVFIFSWYIPLDSLLLTGYARLDHDLLQLPQYSSFTIQTLTITRLNLLVWAWRITFLQVFLSLIWSNHGWRSGRLRFRYSLLMSHWYRYVVHWIVDGLALERSTSGSWAGEFMALAKLDIWPYSSTRARCHPCNTTISLDKSPRIACRLPKLITGCVVCSQKIRLYMRRGLVLQCSKLR